VDANRDIDQVTVFPDTNILLHFKPLADIDWVAVCRAKLVKLVICLEVIDELDDKKRDSRLSDRAKRAIKDIQELRGKEFRPAVTLEVYNHPAGTAPHGYDERILRSVQGYLATHPEDLPAVVVTDDYGMGLRCEAHGVSVLRLPDDHRLELPQEEQTRKLRQAQAELMALKNRLPDLVIRMVAKEDYPAADDCPELRPSDEMEMLDVQRMLDAEQALYRKLGQPAHPLIGINVEKILYGPGQIQRYNAALDDYLERYEKYLREYNEWVQQRGVLYDFDLYLTNQGSSPANQIEVEIIFPAHVHRLLHVGHAQDAFGQPPTRPKPPKEPSPATLVGLPDFEWLKDMGRSSGYDIRLPDPFAPSVEILNLGDHMEDMSGAVLRCHLRELMHTKDEKIGSFSLVFSKGTGVKPFQASYSVLAAELPDKVERQLLFKFKEVGCQQE
jgi:hypothetical protein